MRLILIAAVLLVSVGVCQAGGLEINVLLSGEVAPGIYGQVNIGNERPPPLVYTQPMLIEARQASIKPIYLHVPPEHARDWRRYCHEYDACNRPVYFVRSREYEPEYQRHYQDHERERELERQRWQERQRNQDRDHGRGHEGDEHGHGRVGHDHDGN